MNISEQFQSWVMWSRNNLPSAGEIPKINTQDFKPPFLDDFSTVVSLGASLRQELLACCVGLMTENPSDVPTRFTVLRLYCALAGLFGEDWECAETIRLWTAGQRGFDSQELEMGRAGEEGYRQIAEECDRDADKLMRAFHQDLCLLIRQLKVEDVPAEWRRVRWEILNSCAIEDWDRAADLYRKAEREKLLEEAEFRAIRGQFHYLFVFGPRLDVGLDTLWWEPKLHGRDQAETTVALLLSGLHVFAPESKLNDTEEDALCDARRDLEAALRKRPDLGVVYRSILARTCFALGHYHEAAEHYEHVHNWSGSSSVSSLKTMVYECLVECYRRSGDKEKALETLEKWIAEFPNQRGIQKQLAELRADDRQYEAAYDSLRKEIDLSPEMEQEIGVRLALVFGGIHASSGTLSNYAERFLEANPKMAALIDSMLNAYWSSFIHLGDQARAEWRNGICEMYVFPSIVPENYERCSENATKHFAKVVEMELKSRVFEEFRRINANAANKGVRILGNAGVPHWQKHFDNFLRFGGKLNLEKMTLILEKSTSPKESVVPRFSNWLRQTKPELCKKVQLLWDICEPRGEATHEQMPPESAEKVAQRCRTVLDILTADRIK